MRTPLEILDHWAQGSPNKPFLIQAKIFGWDVYSWQRVADETSRMASYLRFLGFPPKSRIAILAKNSAHWILADLSIWKSGHISVPIYPTAQPQEIIDILMDSGASAVFIGKLDRAETVKKLLPSGMPIIDFDTWGDLIKKEAIALEAATPNLNDIATIIYTSGTGGKPRGAVHSFYSFAYAGTANQNEMNLSPSDRYFAYLSLAHVGERMIIEASALYCGGEIYFPESIATVFERLKEVRPTVFLAVPRVWMKIQEGLIKKLPRFGWFLIPKYLFRRKLGLDKARFLISGAASISPSILVWFQKKLGLSIQEGYGMTENFGYSHFSRKGTVRHGAVGTPLPGVTVQLSNDKEILVSSPCQMRGYFSQSGETKTPFGTGDLGEIDSQGNLYIKGRKKDMIKTSCGKAVFPLGIEKELQETVFEHICVVGSGLPQPMAIVTLSVEFSRSSREKQTQVLLRHLSETNAKLSTHEKLSHLIVVPEHYDKTSWLTPTMKIKRSVLESEFQESFPIWEKSSSRLVWV